MPTWHAPSSTSSFCATACAGSRRERGRRALKEGLAQYYTARVCRRLAAHAPGCAAAYETLLPHQPEAYRVQRAWLEDFTPEEVRYAMIAVRRTARASLAEFEERLVAARREIRRAGGARLVVST
jgi:hypothetical protein